MARGAARQTLGLAERLLLTRGALQVWRSRASGTGGADRAFRGRARRLGRWPPRASTTWPSATALCVSTPPGERLSTPRSCRVGRPRPIQRSPGRVFLTTADYGSGGSIFFAVTGVGWLKQIGIADKYIQQSDPDQERAYQKAFTLELASRSPSSHWSPRFSRCTPSYTASPTSVPGLLLATIVPDQRLPHADLDRLRRMRFLRQRVLIAIDPLVAFAVTIVLGVPVTDTGRW